MISQFKLHYRPLNSDRVYLMNMYLFGLQSDLLLNFLKQVFNCCFFENDQKAPELSIISKNINQVCFKKFAYKFKMKKNISQGEIDALLDSSSQGKQKQQTKKAEKESQVYEQQFNNDEAYQDNFQQQGNISNQQFEKSSKSYPKKSVQAELRNQNSNLTIKRTQALQKPVKKDEQNYSQSFQEHIKEQDQEQNQKQCSELFQHENIQQEELIPQEEVKSEYGSQANDEINNNDQLSWQKQSKIKLRDEDLSEANSQFIDSSKLSNEFNTKTKRDKKQKGVDKNDRSNPLKNQGKIGSKTKINAIKTQLRKEKEKIKDNSGATKGKQKIKASEKEQNKHKFNQVQIAQKMKQIKAEKAKIQKIKLQKKLKQEQAKKQQYQQAKKKQQQRKQRNRQILQQQNRKAKQQAGLNDNTTKINLRDSQKQQDIKLPDKRIDFKYMDLKQQRAKKQKQIKSNIEKANKKKLMELKKVQPKMNFEQKKTLFLQQKNDVKINQVSQKKKQQTQVQNVQVKQIKKDINNIKRQNEEKIKQIHKYQKTIEDYMKKVKSLEKQYYENQPANQKQEKQLLNVNFSQLSAVQKFVSCFSQLSSPKEIFNIFDANKDGLLSIQQISLKMRQYKVDDKIAHQVHSLLDQNSDGNVTVEQFTFIIQNQLKRQQGYRAIMGQVQIIDPLDVEAKIIDMRAEIKYMNQQIDKQKMSQVNSESQTKYQKVMAKIKKIEQKILKKKQDENTKKASNPFNMSPAFLLTHQATRLQKIKQQKTKNLQQVKQIFKKLLKDKGKQLQIKVDEHLNLKNQIHKMKTAIQDTQLAMLSLRKLRVKTKGQVQWQTKIRADLDQLKADVKSYIQKMTQRPQIMKQMSNEEQQNFIAVIILVQRNFRRRHGLKNFKANKNKSQKQ